jgi:hypothetical protein
MLRMLMPRAGGEFISFAAEPGIVGKKLKVSVMPSRYSFACVK